MKFCPCCGNSLITKTIDAVERLACSSAACDYVFWDNPTPVVAAVVVHEDKVVLVRNQGWPEKFFGLVSGFLEKNESPEDAILREIKEELCLEGEIAGMIGIYSFFKMNQLLLVYHVRAKGKIILNLELAEAKSVDPADIKPWPFGTGPAVADWLKSQGLLH